VFNCLKTSPEVNVLELNNDELYIDGNIHNTIVAIAKSAKIFLVDLNNIGLLSQVFDFYKVNKF